MKKLIIAMSVATMAALCAQATDMTVSGVNFENLEVGPLDTTEDDAGTSSETKYWLGNGEVDSQIVDGSQIEGSKNKSKFLKVDETKFLTRTMNGATAAATNLVAETFTDDGVYIKTKVQFTAADTAPEVATGEDKLLVWLKQNEAVGNVGEEGYVPESLVLMVTALDENGVRCDYPVTDKTVNTTDWYTLVIRAAIQDGALAPIGFKVGFADNEGNETFVNNGQIFTSMVHTGAAATTIASIGFQGTGAVDDIEFGTFTEAVVDTFSFSATVNDVYDETASQLPSFASATYSIDGGTPVSFEALSNLAVPTTAQKITLAVTVYDDAKLSNTGAVKDETPVKFDDGTAYVWTLDIDVTGMKKDETKSVTLTIEKIGGGTPSINPAAGDDTISITADTKEAAEAAAIAAITAPDGVEAATYKTYFKATAALQDDGTYTVTVGLDPAVVTPAVVDDANLDIAAGAITVSSKVGLYYSLVKGTTLSTIKDVVKTEAGTGTVLKLVDSTTKGDAAFYKVSVTAVKPTASVTPVTPVEE